MLWVVIGHACLGGRDIIPDYIKECVELTKSGEKKVTWIGLKEDE